MENKIPKDAGADYSARQQAVKILRDHIRKYNSKIPQDSAKINELYRNLLYIPPEQCEEFSGLARSVMIHYRTVAAPDPMEDALEKGLKSMDDEEKFFLNIELTDRLQAGIRVQKLQAIYNKNSHSALSTD